MFSLSGDSAVDDKKVNLLTSMLSLILLDMQLHIYQM